VKISIDSIYSIAFSASLFKEKEDSRGQSEPAELNVVCDERAPSGVYRHIAEAPEQRKFLIEVIATGRADGHAIYKSSSPGGRR
jgi:hypothetical protein